jgi:RecA/RadA recombinase
MSEPKQIKLDKELLKKEKHIDSKTPEEMNSEVTNEQEYDITQLSGVGPKTAEKLREKGYLTLIDIATTRADELSAVMGIGYAQAKVWIDDALDKVSAKMKLQNATDYTKEKNDKTIIFTSGSENLNKLLDGGFKTGTIYGTVGRFATGKTQIGFELVVDCLSKGYSSVFIETEPDTFHLERLQEIANGKGIKNIDWSKLYVCPADQIPTAKAQYLQYKIIQKALERGENIKLIVVDSFNAKFRAGWSRTEMLPLRTREFGEHFTLIEYLTAKYNLCWYLTFQAIAPPRPDQGLQAKVKFGQEFYPIGGDYVLHSVNIWLGLNQVKTELWTAVLFDSSYIDRGTVEFVLCKNGLMDSVK